MKISFLSFLLIVLLSSCGGEDVQKEGKSSNGSDSSESENIEALAAEAVDFEKSLELKRVDGVKLVHDSTTQKLFTGWAKATRENGQLVDLVHVKNGSALTIYKFYENGKKHFKIENSKDRKIKSAISWKPNGEKCPETNVNNGNGVFVRYFETGRKESEQNFKDYEKDGVCTDWYENGNKSKEVSYKNGKLDGFEIFYHEDGTEEIRFIYKDGEQIGRHKEGEGEPAKPSGDPELANEKVKEARSAAEKIATDTLTPAQRWEKLSAYSASYGNCLEDLEVRKSLDQAVASAFDGAGDNLVQESQDEFLLKTQDKGLDFLPKADVERKRAQVVAKMCDRVLEQMKGDDFDVGDGKDFLELFEDPPRVRMDEKGNELPLEEVDYYRFQDNNFVLSKLQEIAEALARMEDSNERKQQSLEDLRAKIARFDKEVLIAWKKFRDTGEVDHGILAQENYLDGLDSESREFSGDEAIDPNDYREIRSALRELRSTWRSFSKEVESKSQKPTPSQPALNPSLDYYNHLKKVLENPLISDMWSYQLLECTPLKTDRPGVYETNRKPLMQLFSYGVVAEKKSQKNFDRFGQPIANPSVTVTQTGMFHWEGKKEGRAFDSTHFNGGIKGFMLDNPQLSATSVFAKRLMSESLNHQTGTLAIPLATLVNKIYLEKSINPTLKAYLHMEVVTMMKAKGDTSSPDHLKILQNFDKIDAGLKSRLSPSLWIDLP